MALLDETFTAEALVSSSLVPECVPTIEEIHSNKDMDLFPSHEELAPIYAQLATAIRNVEAKIHSIQESHLSDARSRGTQPDADADGWQSPAVQQLEGAKVELASQLARVRWIRAPVRRLPVEILQHIFSICCHRCMPSWRFWRESDQGSELSLSRVCKRWRDVTLGMPSLWSSICISYSFLASHLTGLYLDRSGAHPLSIGLYESSSLRFRKALELVVAHCGRWDSLYLANNSDGIDPGHPLMKVKENLPMLSRLTYFSSSGRQSEIIQLFEGSPNLRSVSFSGTFNLRSFWHPVQTVECRPFFVYDFMDLLRHASALQSVELDTSRIDSWFYGWRPLIVSPVQIFSVAFWLDKFAREYRRGNLRRFLDSIVLRDVHIVLIDFRQWHQSEWSIAMEDGAFTRFLSHSFKLSRLSLIGDTKLTKAQLTRILAQVPSLHLLELEEATPERVDEDPSEWFCMNDVNEMLTIHDGNTLDPLLPTLPNLTNLELRVDELPDHGRTFDDVVFARMVVSRSFDASNLEARKPPYRCLQSVNLTFYKRRDLVPEAERMLHDVTSQNRAIKVTVV
jgi:hypothetical protein